MDIQRKTQCLYSLFNMDIDYHKVGHPLKVAFLLCFFFFIKSFVINWSHL